MIKPVFSDYNGVVAFIRLQCELFLWLDLLFLEFFNLSSKYCFGRGSRIDAVCLNNNRIFQAYRVYFNTKSRCIWEVYSSNLFANRQSIDSQDNDVHTKNWRTLITNNSSPTQNEEDWKPAADCSHGNGDIRQRSAFTINTINTPDTLLDGINQLNVAHLFHIAKETIVSSNVIIVSISFRICAVIVSRTRKKFAHVDFLTWDLLKSQVRGFYNMFD